MKVVKDDDGVFLVLEEQEHGTLLKQAHDTPFSTLEVLQRLVACYSANFEQDVADTIKDLEDE